MGMMKFQLLPYITPCSYSMKASQTYGLLCAPSALYIVADNGNVTGGQDGYTHHHHDHYIGECVPHLGAGARCRERSSNKLDPYKLPRSSPVSEELSHTSGLCKGVNKIL